MGRKSARRGVKGVPGRLRAERERKEIEAKEHALRAICATLHTLSATPASDAASVASPSQQLPARETAIAAAFQELRQLALAPHGFVSDAYRQCIWLFLVGCGGFEPLEKHDAAHFVTRCTDAHPPPCAHYDTVRGIRESERRSKRRALTHVINAVLRTNDALHYYQGYHDVCSVFLLALGDQRAFQVVQRVSASYQREAMGSGFEVVMQATRLLFPLLRVEDSELHAYMCASSVEPFFALPWMITWFAHQLPRFQDVARLYDVLLVSHPLFCLYLSAAVVLEARTRVLQCECDFGTMHSLLSKLPLAMDIERVIARAALLIHTTSPRELLALSDADTSTLEHSSYFAYPFEFQQHFRVEAPYVRVPPLVAKRKAEQQRKTHASSAKTSSFLVRAAAIGVVAALASLAYRSRVQPM